MKPKIKNHSAGSLPPMKPQKHFLIWLLGFLLLDLYANGIPWILGNYPTSEISGFFMAHSYSWLLFWLGFFLMAFLIARYLVGVRGLQSFGLALQKNWGKDLLLGFNEAYRLFT